jgi:hypothetical protein
VLLGPALGDALGVALGAGTPEEGARFCIVWGKAEHSSLHWDHLDQLGDPLRASARKPTGPANN